MRCFSKLGTQALSGNRRLVLFHGQDQAPGYLNAPGWSVVPCAVAQSETLPVVVPDWDACDAVLLTSKASAAWYGRQACTEKLVVTSGEGTAALLAAAGKVGIPPEQGHGAKAALTTLSQRLPAGGRVLFPCGERTAGTAQAAAVELGFELRELPVYRMKAIPTVASLGLVLAVGFGSGQIVEFARTALGPLRWKALSVLPALVLGDTARRALSDWNGQVLDLEKTAIQPRTFCIPFALTDEIVSQSTPILDVGC